MKKNELYPIFLKVNQINILIIGGGNVGLEKLSFMLKSSPNANVEVLSISFHDDLIKLVSKHPSVKFIPKVYESSDLKNKHMVIGCTNDHDVNIQISKDCKEKNIMVNIADTPELCDFYLGGIVTKGDVKIAVSTNGKSPTTAKRIRQFLEDVLPDDINDLVQNLNVFRKSIKGDFEQKVEIMNKMTEEFINKQK